jgi:hypothetical protein
MIYTKWTKSVESMYANENDKNLSFGHKTPFLIEKIMREKFS